MSNRRVIACGGKSLTNSPHFIELGVHLSQSTEPKVLLVDTGSTSKLEHDKFVAGITKVTGRYSADIRTLHNFSAEPSRNRAATLCNWADIVIVAGSNALKQDTVWKRTGVDKILHNETERGQITVIGIDAGFSPWFSNTFSDHAQFGNLESQWPYEPMPGFEIVPAWACPAYDTIHPVSKMHRGALFEAHMITQPRGTLGIAVDTHCALVVNGNKVSIANDDRAGGIVRLMRSTGQNSLTRQFLNSMDTDLPLSQFSTN